MRYASLINGSIVYNNGENDGTVFPGTMYEFWNTIDVCTMNDDKMVTTSMYMNMRIKLKVSMQLSDSSIYN